MATPSPRWQLTPRDREILAALNLCPLGAKDLLRLSETFSYPFESLDCARHRLKQLQTARQVQSWRYAVSSTEGGASPLYYKLSRNGYRTLYQDEDAKPPTKRYLNESSVSRHHHQQSLTQYIVKTHVAAHRHTLRITDSFPENTYRIDTPLGQLFPDRRYTVVLPNGEHFVNCVELDNSTETLVSRTNADSVELKMKKYLHDLAANDYNYRVQFVVTKSRERLKHLRQLAMQLQPSVKFAPFYSVMLDDYLATQNPFLSPIFASARSSHVGLLRSRAELFTNEHPSRLTLLAPAAAC